MPEIKIWKLKYVERQKELSENLLATLVNKKRCGMCIISVLTWPYFRDPEHHVGQDALINASGSQPISLRLARQLVWQFLSVWC